MKLLLGHFHFYTDPNFFIVDQTPNLHHYEHGHESPSSSPYRIKITHQISQDLERNPQPVHGHKIILLLMRTILAIPIQYFKYRILVLFRPTSK